MHLSEASIFRVVVVQVPLSAIRPNPFRNIERYPFNPAKIEALRESIRATGFWDNLLARRVPDGDGGLAYEIAYGHHRWEALRLERTSASPDIEVGVTLRPLDDTQMLQIMARENMQEWGTSAAIEIETVRAVVTAYAAGKISLADPGPDVPVSRCRFAPFFTIAEVPDTSPERAYTAATVAPFLGWSVDKVQDTLAALEMIESGVLSDDDYAGLSTSQALAMTQRARQVRDEARQRVRRHEAESEESRQQAAAARAAEEEARRRQEAARQQAMAERDEQMRQHAANVERKAKEAWEEARAQRELHENKAVTASQAAARERAEAPSRAAQAARSAGDQMRGGASVREVTRQLPPAAPPPDGGPLSPAPYPLDGDATKAAQILQRMLKESDIAAILMQATVNKVVVSPECRALLAGALTALAEDAISWRGRLLELAPAAAGVS
jgi:hypothetical protein